MSVWDELRFGPERTLNLREALPTAAEAVRRADRWLREQQVRGAAEVLVVTGRGSHSIDGIAVLRESVAKLLTSLRKRGVVASHQEHNPGAFAVQLAPLRTLLEAPARGGDTRRVGTVPAFEGLDAETSDLLRQLAERSLDALGVAATPSRLRDEMHRHVAVLVPALPPSKQLDEQLRAAIRSALEQYD